MTFRVWVEEDGKERYSIAVESDIQCFIQDLGMVVPAQIRELKRQHESKQRVVSSGEKRPCPCESAID